MDNPKEELSILLWEMNVPDARRELTDQNIYWLSRNLPVIENTHSYLDKAMHYISLLVKVV